MASGTLNVPMYLVPGAGTFQVAHYVHHLRLFFGWKPVNGTPGVPKYRFSRARAHVMVHPVYQFAPIFG